MFYIHGFYWTKKVDKVIPECGHSILVERNHTVTRHDCTSRCNKLLDCGPVHFHAGDLAILQLAVHANGKLNRKVLNHFFQVAPHNKVKLCFLRIKQKVKNLIAIKNALDMRKNVLQTCSTEFAVKFVSASLSAVISNCSL
jgi:hypothetical protein